MFFQQRFVPGLAIYSYIVGDELTREAAVIDPTRDVDDFIHVVKREGLHIRHILETHVHADFVSGSRELKNRLQGDPIIHASGMGGEEWTPPYADHVVQDGEQITMGTVRLEALHTPGHTMEHLSWLLYDDTRSKDTPWLVFTGDFAFVGDVGRPDLLGAEARKRLAHRLYESVFGRLSQLPDFVEIFPGHGAGSLCGKAIGSRSSSTLGYERRFNPALQAMPEEEWVSNLMDQMPLAPSYFSRMKRINREGPEIIGLELSGQKPWSPQVVYEQVCEHCLILDVRSKESFAAALIPGAVNIPLGPSFSSWAGWVLPYETPMLVVLENASQMTEVTTQLLRVGFDDIRGYLEGGIDAWQMGGFPVERLSTQSVHQLKNVLEAGSERPTVGALHIHGGKLQERFGEVDREKPVAVVCGSGYRGSIAASFLKREGYRAVSNILGGMSAWTAAGFWVKKTTGPDVEVSSAGEGIGQK